LLFSMRLIWYHQISLGMAKTIPGRLSDIADRLPWPNGFHRFASPMTITRTTISMAVYFIRDSHISFESQI